MSNQKKKKSTFFNKVKTFLKFSIVIILIAGLIGFGASIMLIKNALAEVKPIDPSRIDERLVENSVIYDSDGVELENIDAGGLRTLIDYEDMSNHLINAIVSIEDKTFFDHMGFNFVRMVGAVRDAIFKGERIGGTSTITQQLARNLYLFEDRSERTLNRKIKEGYYALQLEKYLRKEQIIEAYLNTIYLGANTKGVEAASNRYFSKSADALTLEEAAILAGIPKSPTQYAPMLTKHNDDITPDDYVIKKIDEQYSYVYNPGVEDRYKLVLRLMNDYGYISDERFEEAKAVDLKTLLKPGIEKSNEISSYFVDMVTDEVINDLMDEFGYTEDEATAMIQTGGLKIHSTIDFDMQKTLENAYAVDNFTEYYGPSMAGAVKQFQRLYDLAIDGIAGQGTLSKLAELGYFNLDEFEQDTYRIGQEHKDVVKIKEALYNENLFSNNDLFPKLKVNLDSNGNILNQERSRIILYQYDNLVNNQKQLVIPESDYFFDDGGNLVLRKNKKLNFYSHYDGEILDRIQVVVKDTYKNDNEEISGSTALFEDMYTHQGRDLLIPDEYKSYDDNENVVISKAFLESEDNIFKTEDNKLLVDDENYVIEDRGVIQPQSSMVIVDQTTGELKAVVGGRNVSGQKIYNRAVNPRQPGSSIKPLAVYTPAIATHQYTAASVVDDVPTYLGNDPNKRWPLNWYEHQEFKYRGISTVREGIEQSMNVVTAKIANDLGIETCINALKDFGISTIVEEGYVNDYNLSAVSLGGMTKGIKPIEMAEAYSTFANKGVKIDTHTYTQVIDNYGEVLLDKSPHKEVVLDEEVAFLIQDMMRTGVTQGVASKAKITPNNSDIPVAGKTGTTSNKLDAWFAGYTPYYTGITWFGNDYNLELNEGSSISAEFWSYVMKNLHNDLANKSFDPAPEDLVRIKVDTKSGKLPSRLSYLDPRGTVKYEYFINGTQPTQVDDVHVAVKVDKISGLLPTENCPPELIEEQVFTKRLVGRYDPDRGYYFRPNSNEPIGLKIRDGQYNPPMQRCDLHDGSDTEEDFVRHITFFVNGSSVVVKPFNMYLKDETVVELPIRTRITENKDVILPDGTIYKNDEILDIPYYEYEKRLFLERRNKSTTEDETDPTTDETDTTDDVPDTTNDQTIPTE